MIGIVDYQVGNVGNVLRALKVLDFDAGVIANPLLVTKDTDTLILPGVGAFGPAMESLEKSGWATFLNAWNKMGLPILGICLGMQLMCDKSLENGVHKGLGFIQGTVTSLGTQKLPHMGWNNITWNGRTPLLASSVPDGTFFYFVHSFALFESPDTAAMTRVENKDFVSIIVKDNLAGFQFHPERSGLHGLRLLGTTLSYLMGI